MTGWAKKEEEMILNTGGRTDTVQYYSEWLLNRSEISWRRGRMGL